jgi:hypothetical protein
MKTFTVKLILAGAAFSFTGCASQSAANRERETLASMSFTGELLKYRCGGYRPDVGQPMPSMPEGYSKDAAGYRTTPVPHQNDRRAPTPRGYVVKAYRIGPHVDPSNPRLVQGAHTAYQLVGDPGWNLHTVRRVKTPVPPYAPAPEQPRALTEATRRAEEAERRADELQRRVEAVEEAQRANAQAQNANQQLIVDQINSLKARSGQPAQPTQADPNSP